MERWGKVVVISGCDDRSCAWVHQPFSRDAIPVARHSVDHFTLVRQGLELHEARQYARALPYFERACALAPRCPTARYNRANTLFMRNQCEPAYALLGEIVGSSLDELRAGCPECGARGLQLDAYFLLALVVRHAHGDCEEALRYADEHLKRRKRGLMSIWTIDEVRAERESIRIGIEEARRSATGTAKRRR
jgi:tetratricopeptide (TPR) repeat protein